MIGATLQLAAKVAEAKAHVDGIAARPRAAGGDEERAALEYCRASLTAAGFATHDEPFEYSAFPGRYATSVAGIASTVVVGIAASLGYAGRSRTALALLISAAFLLGAFATLIAVRGVLGLGWSRARSANLVAVRGTPTVWLMAHIDSKSQPVSMAARVAAIVGSALVWIAAITLSATGTMTGLSTEWREIGWPVIAVAGIVAGVPVAASLVTNRSPGAFDNASGVATVLLAVNALPAQANLGVVITSAEELGMAGARAWVRSRSPGVAINVDGVDDAGMLTAMTTRRGSARLAATFKRAASSVETRHRVIRLVPGILVDAVALADAGWESITVSHGTFGSLARIHTAADTPDRLTGAGVARAATVVAAMVTELA